MKTEERVFFRETKQPGQWMNEWIKWAHQEKSEPSISENNNKWRWKHENIDDALTHRSFPLSGKSLICVHKKSKDTQTFVIFPFQLGYPHLQSVPIMPTTFEYFTIILLKIQSFFFFFLFFSKSHLSFQLSMFLFLFLYTYFNYFFHGFCKNY